MSLNLLVGTLNNKSNTENRKVQRLTIMLMTVKLIDTNTVLSMSKPAMELFFSFCTHATGSYIAAGSSEK